MPTGYTAGIADGTITDLSGFAMRCARAFMPLISMRDEPMGAPIPDRLGKESYYAECLAEKQQELAELEAMTPEQRQAGADADIAERNAQNAKWKADKAERRQRYEAMIAKVGAWEGSPEGVKDFALQQLRESLKYDCNLDDSWYQSLEPMTGQEWFDQRVVELTKDIERAASEVCRETENAQAANAWLAQLRKSLESQ